MSPIVSLLKTICRSMESWGLSGLCQGEKLCVLVWTNFQYFMAAQFKSIFPVSTQFLCSITFTRPVMRERMMNGFFFSNCCYYCKIITRAIESIMYIIKYYIQGFHGFWGKYLHMYSCTFAFKILGLLGFSFQ